MYPLDEWVFDIPHHSRSASHIRCVDTRAYGVGGVGDYEDSDAGCESKDDAGCECKTLASHFCRGET